MFLCAFCEIFRNTVFFQNNVLLISLLRYFQIHESLSIPSTPKNSKFKILLVKDFSLKQKYQSNTSSYYQANQIMPIQEKASFYQSNSSKTKSSKECIRNHFRQVLRFFTQFFVVHIFSPIGRPFCPNQLI